MIWPVEVDAAGKVLDTDPDDPDADVLAIDLDPTTHERALVALADRGRLFVAGPEAGPVPLVVDLDPHLVADALATAQAMTGD